MFTRLGYCFCCGFWPELDLSKFIFFLKAVPLWPQGLALLTTASAAVWAQGHYQQHSIQVMTCSCCPCPKSWPSLLLRRTLPFSCSKWTITAHLPFAAGSHAWASPAARPVSCRSVGIILLAKHSYLLIITWYGLSNTFQQLIKIRARGKAGNRISVSTWEFHVCSWNVNVFMKNYLVGVFFSSLKFQEKKST